MSHLSRRSAGGSRKRLVGNATKVALGLGAVGVGTLLAVAFAARALSPPDFAVFVTWWTVTNLVALVFALTEAYLPRVIIGRDAGVDERHLIARFARAQVAALILLVALVVLLSGWSSRVLFDGQVLLPWATLLYSTIAAAQSLQRGVATGRSRFDVTAVQLGTDGLARMLWCTGLLLIGASQPDAFAAALCLASAFGVGAAALRMSGWLCWSTPDDVRVAWRPLVWLSPAILVPLAVNNSTVPWLAATGGVTALELGAFAGAVTLSRILTLLVGAAYGPVLSPLATVVEAGEFDQFRRIHRGAVMLAGGIGLVFTVGMWVLGPWMLSIYLGPSYSLGPGIFGVLALGSAFMFLSVVEQASLVALSHWRGVAIGWGIGLAVFVTTLATSMSPVAGAALAMTVAPAVATVVMWFSRARSLPHVSTASCGS